MTEKTGTSRWVPVGTSCVADTNTAGAAAAGCIDDVAEWSHRVLLLLTDGLGGDQQEVVRGADSVAGPAVPLVGGCAGDDLAMNQTFQLHGGSAPPTASASAMGGAGWRAQVGDRSAANRLCTLYDRPALEA